MANEEANSLYRLMVRRALAASQPELLQLHFDIAVLDHYRQTGGFALIRTDTVGRLRKQGAWSLDFGIAPDEDSIHLTWGDLQRLPESEREHWSGWAVLPPASKMFLQMRLAPGSCFDDGEVRSW